MKLLVVDDDDIVQSMLKNVLVQAGFEVMLAGDGKEALDLLQHGDCRLVLSDWEMPVMDGLELCKKVRSGEFPDYVYFNHSAHVRRGVGCVSCHGRIDTMEVVTQVESLSMGWCLDCHRKPELHLRPTEFVTQLD